MVTENNSTQSNVAEPKEQSQENKSAEPTEIVAPVKDEQKDDEPIKQDDNETIKGEDNKTLSALEAQILDGKSVADLEETAAGNSADEKNKIIDSTTVGDNSGEGVSLSAATFALSGHESSIHADYKAISELSHNFETPINSIRGAIAEAQTTVSAAFFSDPLKFKITMDNESSREGSLDYIIYSLKAEDVPADFGTTNLKLAFGGQATPGEDYSTVEYSLDGTNWRSVDADMIIKDVALSAGASEVKVRVKVIDDYGLNKGNQNEGDEVENYNRTELDHHITAGKYAEKLSLSVTSTDGRVESNTANGYIVDNDDFVTVSSSIAATPFDYSGFTGPINYSSADLGSNVAEKNKTIDTGDGDDTVRLTDGSMEYLTINTGDGNDRVEFANNSNLMVNHVTINTGAGDDIISFTDRTMNGKLESVDNGDCLHNSIIDGGDGLDTLQVSSGAPFPSFLSFISCKNIEIVDITNVPHYDYFETYTEDGERKEIIDDGSYPRTEDGYIDLGNGDVAALHHEGMNIKISHSPTINFDPSDGHPTLEYYGTNPLDEIVNLIDRFNDSTHELFLKSDVKGHNLDLWGQDHDWVGKGYENDEPNIAHTLEKLGVTRTEGEGTYRLDFDYNDTHYALTCSNTIGINFTRLDVPYIGL